MDPTVRIYLFSLFMFFTQFAGAKDVTSWSAIPNIPDNLNLVDRQIPSYYPEQPINHRDFSIRYYFPNERAPRYARQILEQIPDGVMISVGADRTINHAGIAKNITHLLQVDNNPGIVYYNVVNTILLKLAKHHDLGDYLFLRERATFKEIEERVQQSSLNEQEREFILNPRTYFILNITARKKDIIGRFPVPRLSMGFLGANYTLHSRQFNRVQDLALKDRVKQIVAHVDDPEFIQKISDVLSEDSLKLAAVDLSNILQGGYINNQGLNTLINGWKEFAHPKALLFLTEMTLGSMLTGRAFRYLGFEWNDILINGNPRRLNQQLVDHVTSGRITSDLSITEPLAVPEPPRSYSELMRRIWKGKTYKSNRINRISDQGLIVDNNARCFRFYH